MRFLAYVEEKCVTARAQSLGGKLQSGGSTELGLELFSVHMFIPFKPKQGPRVASFRPAERSSAFSSRQPAGWACFPGALPEARPGAASQLGPPSQRACLLIQEMRVVMSLREGG